MASYNRVILVGNLTRDPEVRYLQSGMAVADIGLAVNDRKKDPNTGNMVEEATFVDVTLWARNAEVVAEYARKGTSILIEGRLKLDTWESDGQKRSKLKVIGDRLCLLGGRPGGGQDGGYSGGGQYNRGNAGGGYGGQGQYSGGNSQGQYGGGNNQGQYGGGASNQYNNTPPQYDGPPDIPGPSPDDIPF